MIACSSIRYARYLTNMIKTSCDICKKEINQREIAGQLMYVKKTFIPNINAAQPDQPTMEQKQAHFCEGCLEKVTKLLK